MQIGDIVGLRVYSLHTGTQLGYIVGFSLNKTFDKIKTFSVANDEDDFERTLSCNRIYRVHDSCIFVANDSCVTAQEHEQENFSSVIGKHAVDVLSGDLGCITTIEIDDKFSVKNFVFSNGKRAVPRQACEMGKDCFVFCLQDEKFSTKKLAPRKKSVFENLKVSLLTMQEPPPYDSAQKKIAIPKITIEPIESSLGKIASKTVVGRNNELIVKKGEKITQATIEHAKRHNIVSF